MNPRHQHRLQRSLVPISPLAAVACFLLQSPSGCSKPAAPPAGDEAPQTAPLQRNDVVVAQAQNVPRLVPLLGNLTSDSRTQLAANAAGRVTTVQVERGQRVARDQVLLTLDVRQATHVVRESRANLQNLQAMRSVARADCGRFEALAKKQAITQQEYDRAMAQCHEADAQYEAAEARNQEAQRNLKDGEVRAPFAGVVTERMVNVGDYVRQDSPVATLLVPDPLRLQCGVPEAYAQAAKVGGEVQFEVAAYPERTFCAQVRFVSGEVRAATRDILIEALVQNPNGALLPGMFATAHLVVGTRTLPVVPRTAVTSLGAEKAIYVVRDKHVEQHIVRLGPAFGEFTALESGVEVGDQVLSHPDEHVVDGMSVQ